MPRTLSARASIGLAVAIVLLGAGPGCRNASPKPASFEALSGTVRLDGKPVNYGSITFVLENGQSVKGIIQTDGTYRIRKPSPGLAKVVVETGPAPRAISAPGGKGAASVNFETIQIPVRYTSAETTDLRCQITSDNNEFHVEMKSAPGQP